MAERFAIRFTTFNHSLRLLGLGPRSSWVELGPDALRVRMGWAFSLVAPLAAIGSARLDERGVWSWGVHGWRGRWLVNGSSSGIVRVDFEPSVRARTGPFPIRVRELRVSVEEPDRLVAALDAIRR